MIITCSQCQTRFKVGDDKLASGPIRVRCSKCNHVFMASSAGPAAPPASPSQPPSSTLPPTMVSTVPPQQSFVPSSPTPRPVVGPITGMFQAFGAAESPSASGFGSPSNRSGIFKAPASDFRQPTNDPFAGLAQPRPVAAPPPAPPSFPPPSFPPPSMAPPSFPPPSFPPPSFPSQAMPPQGQPPPPMPPRAMSPVPSMPPRAMSPPVQPRPQAPDPFGSAPDPFAGIAPPPAPDPFSGVAPPSAPDPFGGAAPAPSFGGGAPVADPFASLATAAATPHAKDPFRLGTPSPSAAPAFAPPPPPAPSPFGAAPFSFDADPSARTEGHNTADLFGAGAQLATDPFGQSASPQNAGAGVAPVDDPFGNLDLGAGSVESMTPTGPPSPPPEETDPFADLDIGGDAASGAAPMDDPFDRPAPPPRPPPPPPAPVAEPRASLAPAAASSSTLPPAAAADPAKLRRLEATQRVRAIAWAAVQLLIFVAFLVVAVVLGRGGTLDDLLRGDLNAALGGPRVEGNLAIEHPRVKKRTLPSGIDVVIVSGEVRNTTQSPVPGARVEVRLGTQPPTASWAWTTLDGVDLATVPDAAALAALATRLPASASLAPGERAPFVVVAPAAEDGLAASFSVQAVAPPPAAAAPLVPPPVPPPAAP